LIATFSPRTPIAYAQKPPYCGTYLCGDLSKVTRFSFDENLNGTPLNSEVNFLSPFIEVLLK
jgi:hypothetical protein